MTDQEINIQIAQACGWKLVPAPSIPTGDQTWFVTNPSGEFLGRYAFLGLTKIGLPNYCDDLNAMHEAEAQLDGMRTDTRSLYYDYILLQCAELFEKQQDGLKRDPFDSNWAALRATARQRAEAFLRTLGKWKE